MSFFSNSSDAGGDVAASPIGLDLSAIMRQVYLWMGLGLLVAFGVAFIFDNAANNAITAYQAGYQVATPLILSPIAMIVAFILYLILTFTVQPVIYRSSIAVGSAIYLVYTAVFGFLIATIIMDYTPGQIAVAFVSAAGMFGAMSIVGYTTKVDLSRFGGLLIMAVIGLIIASFANILFQSSGLDMLISYAGVLIFTALAAYNTQWIKRTAAQAASAGNPDFAQRVALIGALHLFVTFVNLFLFLLRVQGGGRGGRR